MKVPLCPSRVADVVKSVLPLYRVEVPRKKAKAPSSEAVVVKIPPNKMVGSAIVRLIYPPRDLGRALRRSGGVSSGMERLNRRKTRKTISCVLQSLGKNVLVTEAGL